jgi:hypothetical protein
MLSKKWAKSFVDKEVATTLQKLLQTVKLADLAHPRAKQADVTKVKEEVRARLKRLGVQPNEASELCSQGVPEQAQKPDGILRGTRGGRGASGKDGRARRAKGV